MSHSEQFWSKLWSLCGLHCSWWHIADFLSGIVHNYKVGYYSWLYCVLFLTYRYCKGARGSGFKLKEDQFGLDIRKIFARETLALVTQKSGGCSIPENTEGQVGWLWAAWLSWRCPCSLQEGWTVWPLKVPSTANHPIILWLHMIFTCFWI